MLVLAPQSSLCPTGAQIAFWLLRFRSRSFALLIALASVVRARACVHHRCVAFNRALLLNEGFFGLMGVICTAIPRPL